MDNQTEEEIIEKVSKHEFYFETPLYDVIEIGNWMVIYSKVM